MTDVPIAHQRVRAGAAATLEVTFTDQDGEPTEPGGTVTVEVVAADGVEVLAAGTATDTVDDEPGVRTVELTPMQTATLELLTATWIEDADDATVETLVEIVGGFYFTVPEAKRLRPHLRSSGHDDDAILRARLEVERECERITGVSWVPRYHRARLDGTGTSELILPHREVREIRSVRIYSAPTTYTAFTSDQLAALAVHADGRLGRPDDLWRAGHRNVVVEYEHGHDRPPEDLQRAQLEHLEWILTRPVSSIDARATSYTTTEGGTYRLDQAGPHKVGLPSVDAVYLAYSGRADGDGGGSAVSMQLNYDPQRDSLFHGGVR